LLSGGAKRRLSSYVIDASALLAAINDEPGGEVLGTIIEPLLISAVNLSEVIARLADRGAPREFVDTLLESFDLDVRPFDRTQAYEAGMLRPATRPQGLSFGDRACVALARLEGLPLLTAERAWRQLNLDVEVRLLR
jgi:ribonuclease VapC